MSASSKDAHPDATVTVPGLGKLPIPNWALPDAARNRLAAKAKAKHKIPKPGVQEYGEPVQSRLQERLEDPAWVNRIADKCDARKRKAEADQALNPAASNKMNINPTVPIGGLPAPDAKYLGSSHKMAAHFMTYDPTFKTAINYNEGGKSKVVLGRPVQLICLSHEMAGFLERDPYLSWLFRPLPVNVLLGYSAEAEDAPEGPKHHCVIRWCQVIVCLSTISA